MRKLFACLVVLLSALCFVPTKQAEAANWVWVTSTDYVTISIDSSSARSYSGTVYFWDKWAYIDSPERTARAEDLVESEQKYGDGSTDYSDLYTIVSQVRAYKARDGVIYCQLLGLTYYDSRGNVISTMTTPPALLKWTAVPPDTFAESEFYVAQSYAR